MLPKAATITLLTAATTLRSGDTSIVDTDLQQPITVRQL